MVESSREESIASSDSPSHPDHSESQPPEQADAEGAQAETFEGALAISAEEENLLLGDTAPATGRSPVSNTSSVAGHLASLQVSTPPRGVSEDGDTSK